MTRKMDREVGISKEDMAFMPRFFARFTKGKKNECWEAAGYPIGGGYVQIRMAKRRLQRIHRISYKYYIGNIPIGLHVLHSCDNPRCVNPSHLFIGTDQDNADDKISKGRQGAARGERNKGCKLTNKQVLEIRRVHNKCLGSKNGTKNLASKYNVHPSTIQRIVNNKRWRHL